MSFGEWLGKVTMLCVCLALAAKPVAAFALMMQDACAPARSVSAASHDISGHAHADMSGHDPVAAAGIDRAEKPHAPSATTCCGMLCAVALLPVHDGAPAPLALFSSILPGLEQARADGWAGRLFRPPRVA